MVPDPLQPTYHRSLSEHVSTLDYMLKIICYHSTPQECDDGFEVMIELFLKLMTGSFSTPLVIQNGKVSLLDRRWNTLEDLLLPLGQQAHYRDTTQLFYPDNRFVSRNRHNLRYKQILVDYLKHLGLLPSDWVVVEMSQNLTVHWGIQFWNLIHVIALAADRYFNTFWLDHRGSTLKEIEGRPSYREYRQIADCVYLFFQKYLPLSIPCQACADHYIEVIGDFSRRALTQPDQDRGTAPAAFCLFSNSPLLTRDKQTLYIAKAVDKAEDTAIRPRMRASKPAGLERFSCSSMVLTIMDLPLEMLVMIFGFLSVVERSKTVARVCSSWRAICQAPLFWTELTLPWYCVKYAPDCIQAYRRVLAQHAEHIRTLCVVKLDCEVFKAFDQLQFPNLKTVKLEYFSFDFARALVKACPVVEDLLVYIIHDLDIEVFDALCSWRQLRRVAISCETWGFGGERIYSQLFRNCEHLESVSICFGRYNYISDQGLHLLAQKHHTTLCHFELISDDVTTLAPLLDCHRLTHLKLNISDNVPDDDFVALRGLPELTHLELNNKSPSSLALYRFFSRSLKLTHLRLIYMDITSDIMGRIASSCSQLQSLDIHGESITNEMILPLFDHAMHLQSMVLWADMKVTEDIFQLFPSKLPQLQRLLLPPDDWDMIQRILPEMDLSGSLLTSWPPSVYF